VRIRRRPKDESPGPLALPLTRRDASELVEALRRELGDLATVFRPTPRDPVSPRRFVVASGPAAVELTAREARDLLDAIEALLEDPTEHRHIYDDGYFDEVVAYLDEAATGHPSVRELAN
jgi:hypothetical protein